MGGLERWPVIALLLALAAGCAGGPGPPATLEGARVRVLGTVQDGGLPHAGCRCRRCEAARNDPARARNIASLALLLPDGETWVIDATPDLRAQLALLHDVTGPPPGAIERQPIDGVLLTHAHIGHYAGLMFFGFESLHTRDLPVLCSPRMAGFLRDNGPWGQLVELGNISLREIHPRETLELAGVRITPLLVPHRDEYADTLGFIIGGPRSTLLYLPDTDAWHVWREPFLATIDRVDVAVLDATFFSAGELPGRDASAIPHPLIEATMDLLGERVASGKLRVYLTHLNHTNPAIEADSPERAEIERRGFRVLEEGDEFPL